MVWTKYVPRHKFHIRASTVVCYREIGLLINIVLKTRGPPGDILLIWGGRGWYSKPFVKFWIWVYSPFACKWPLKLLNKRPRLTHKNWYKSVICWPILMKFCMQPPIRPSFALANFQLGRKGQRPKGRKVKRPNFQKLSEAFFIKSKVVHNVFMSIFKLKGPISRNFALELIVGWSENKPYWFDFMLW